jgi:hypothetical protein
MFVIAIIIGTVVTAVAINAVKVMTSRRAPAAAVA